MQKDYRKSFVMLTWVFIGLIVLAPITISLFVNSIALKIISLIFEVIILFVFIGFASTAYDYIELKKKFRRKR